MPKTLLSLLAAACLLIGLAHSAEARRVALVIGNSGYSDLKKLSNPAKDAAAIAGILRSHGFEVEEHHDLDRANFLDALEAFGEKAVGSDLALVFYAGHGMEVAGKDILAPTDMQISCEKKEARRAVPLERLFDSLKGARNQIVLLDSCRTDPFPQCPTRGSDGGGFRGLSRVTSDGAMLIANSTSPGALAADGIPGEHSPFAGVLIERFNAQPKLLFRDLLDQVAEEVRIATRSQQVPEITARGGSPRQCLDADGCEGGGGGGTAVSDGLVDRDVQKLLRDLGYLENAEADPEQVEKAIRGFQTDAGLTPDGRSSTTLLAMLTTYRLQGGKRLKDVFTGEVEHPVGSIFKDCDECPEMVVLRDGRGIVGSPAKEPGRQASEGPQVEIRIAKPFAVGKLEITYDQWESCALEGGCNGYRPKDAGSGKGAKPAAHVSWDDAKAYVAWLRQHTGKSYRLLSEAEWEYAARAGTTTAYSTGEGITTAEANYDGSQQGNVRKVGDYLGKSSDAGAYGPNPFGLHDMHGNVAEWVEDCWNNSHAGATADAASRGGDCRRRVAKGGAWYFEASYARSAARLSYPQSKRLNILGFRVARDLQ